MGRLLVVIGLAVVAVGVMIWIFPRAFAWIGGWFGNLPGDIRIERGGTRVFIPLGSMLVVSLVLTSALNVLARVFGRGG